MNLRLRPATAMWVFLLSSFCQAQVYLSLGPEFIGPNNEFSMAVTVRGTKDFQAGKIELVYGGIRFEQVEKGSLLAEAMVAHNVTSRSVLFSFASVKPVEGGGELFRMLGTREAEAGWYVAITRARFNEGRIEVVITGGQRGQGPQPTPTPSIAPGEESHPVEGQEGEPDRSLLSGVKYPSSMQDEEAEDRPKLTEATEKAKTRSEALAKAAGNRGKTITSGAPGAARRIEVGESGAGELLGLCTLSLAPAMTNVSIGGSRQIEIRLGNPRGLSFQICQIALCFNPQFLTVLDTDADNLSTEGINIREAPSLRSIEGVEVVNQVDNTKGLITFGLELKQGRFCLAGTLGVLSVQGKQVVRSAKLTFDAKRTKVIRDGENILGSSLDSLTGLVGADILVR